MSSNGALELRTAMTPQRAGQATMVEQSRAVAEVHAMVVVAQQMPRNIDRAVREMQRSCSYRSVAEKAFYRYKRGGSQVTGESITLAKELARCWGNIDYGLAELRRDDYNGESEMMAFAWDLETNTRPRTTFIVPHVRDNGTRLTQPRDIYENNANMGVRRMREQILNLMPPWFIEDAKALCYATMAADDSDGKTIAERSATAVKRYAGIGVTVSQLAQKLGAPQAAWSAADLAQLGVIYKSIERGETTKEDEFGATSATISPSDLAPPQNVPSAPASPPVPPEAESAGGMRTYDDLITFIGEQLVRLEVNDARDQLRAVSLITGKNIKSPRGITEAEAVKVADTLEAIDGPGPDGLLADLATKDDPREVPGE